MQACEIRERLLIQWKEAAESYALLVSSIFQKLGTISSEETDALLQHADELARSAEQLREELDAHRAAHARLRILLRASFYLHVNRQFKA
jgi:hypothetical protein